MIVCGWCGNATEPGRCSSCGRNAALPYEQRGQNPPTASQSHAAGRPRLDASQIRQTLRIALKELGANATNAQLAEHLDIGDTTLRNWRKVAGL